MARSGESGFDVVRQVCYGKAGGGKAWSCWVWHGMAGSVRRVAVEYDAVW